MGGGSTKDYSSLPVYDSQADVDYATRKGLLKNGDSVRIGNSIYQLDRDAGWGHMRTLPPGTFPSATDATNNGILNPLPEITDGILNPSPTGGITDPNYKSLGEYLVGPTYTGPTTADEYVMQRAGGPAWDYSYPMYLGAGGYGPGNTIPTVDSTGDWTTTTPITDTTTDTTDTTTDTTDTTTTTTTTTDDDTIIREGPQPNNDFDIDNFRWDSYTNNAAGVPMFPNTNQGATDYERYSSANPQSLGLLDGLNRTGSGMRPGTTAASYGGAGDPTWSGFASTGIPGSGISDLPSRWRQGLESKNSAQIAKEIQMDEDWGPIGPAVDYGAGLLSGSQPSVGSYEMDVAPISIPVQHTGINQAQFEEVTQPVSTSQIKQNQMAVAVQQQQAIQQQQAQQAAIAEQQRQQQAQEVQAAQDRMRQARAIMNSRDYQEGGAGNLSAQQRDVLAAAQVDTFAGMPMGGGFMGADIGREDGGGFTGGDFSGGAGWE